MATVDAVIKISISTSRGRNFPISRQRITDCVHAMWDEGLQYDDASKVLARLIAEVRTYLDDVLACVYAYCICKIYLLVCTPIASVRSTCLCLRLLHL